MKGTINSCCGPFPLNRPATALVTGYGWVSELPGRDRRGRKLTGAEARSDWGFSPLSKDALKLKPFYQVRLYAYYTKVRRVPISFSGEK